MQPEPTKETEQAEQEKKVQICNVFGVMIKDIKEKGENNG